MKRFAYRYSLVGSFTSPALGFFYAWHPQGNPSVVTFSFAFGLVLMAASYYLHTNLKAQQQ